MPEWLDEVYLKGVRFEAYISVDDILLIQNKDNVLITDDCRAVITDFGISFVMGVTTFATSSSSHKGGTVRWEAPEVLSGSTNSLPADVYSLACVYFEVRVAQASRSL